MHSRDLDRVRRSAPPGRDRDRQLLGQAFCRDLVAQAAHRRAVGTDEGDPQAVAELDKVRAFCHEAPARPHRIGVRFANGALEPVEIQVRALPLAVALVNKRGGTEIEGFVRFPDESRVLIGLSEERDRNELGGVFQVELADGVDDTHRRFAAIDDCYTPEIAVHEASVCRQKTHASSPARDQACRHQGRHGLGTAGREIVPQRYKLRGDGKAASNPARRAGPGTRRIAPARLLFHLDGDNDIERM